MSTENVAAGSHVLGVRFERTGVGDDGFTPLGDVTLHIDDRAVGSRSGVRMQPAMFSGVGEGIRIGRDPGQSVSAAYRAPFGFRAEPSRRSSPTCPASPISTSSVRSRGPSRTTEGCALCAFLVGRLPERRTGGEAAQDQGRPRWFLSCPRVRMVGMPPKPRCPPKHSGRPRGQPDEGLRVGGHPVHALAGVSAEFARGEFTAIMGPSGSGKSTLMHCLAGLDAASSGAVHRCHDLTTLSDKQMTQLRRDRIGSCSSVQPGADAHGTGEHHAAAGHRRPKGRQQWLDTVVDRLGLRDRLDHRPVNCLVVSSSESHARGRSPGSRRSSSVDEPNRQSRFAFVRGGALDPASGGRRFQDRPVIVTHDPRAASFADRVVFLADGQIVDELREPTAESVLDRMKTSRRSDSGRDPIHRCERCRCATSPPTRCGSS